MTTMSDATTAQARSGSNRGILCPKCEHLSPPGTGTCGRCGAHLHITCNKCGQRSPRVFERCSSCGHRLHRSLASRFQRRLRKLLPKRVKPLHLALLVIGILVAYKVVVFLAEYRPPAAE